MFYPIHTANLSAIRALGRSDLFLILEVIKKIINLAPLFIGAFVGIFPMLYTALAVNVIAFFLNSYFTGKQLGYSSWMQIKDVTPSYGIAFVVAISIFFLKYLPLSYWAVLPIQIIIGVLVFVIVSDYFKMEEYRELMVLVRTAINKVKSYKL